MDLRRRFIFRGNAAAIGGRIVRPVDLMLESSTASSLPVVGGRSRAETGATRFGELVSFGAAATFAEGVFDDVQRQIELTHHRVSEDALTTSTHVTADVKGFSLNIDPGFTVKRVHAALRSTSPTGSGEPAIAVTSDTVIEGAAIGGHALIIELAIPLFQRYDTRSKLLAAADDPEFVKESGDCLFMRASMGGTPPPAVAQAAPLVGNDVRHDRQVNPLGRRSVSGRTDRTSLDHRPRLRPDLLRRAPGDRSIAAPHHAALRAWFAGRRLRRVRGG